jgi:hypothetical protein
MPGWRGTGPGDRSLKEDLQPSLFIGHGVNADLLIELDVDDGALAA